MTANEDTRVRYEQEPEYRAIFEASSDGLVINDAETGVVLEANPAFCHMHGYAAMNGMHPTSFIHPSSHQLFQQYVRAVGDGREWRGRARDVRRDGTVFDVEVLGRGFVYQGRFALLGVVRDVTEHVQAYQDLERRVAERTLEIERRGNVAEALSELLTVLNSGHTLDEILDYVVAQARSLLGSDAEALYLLDERDPRILRLQASRSLPPDTCTPTLPTGAPVMGLAAERHRPVVVTDFLRLVSQPFAETVDQQIRDRGAYLEVVQPGPQSAGKPLAQLRNLTMATQFRTLVSVPLLAGGASYGTLTLAYHVAQEPSAEMLELSAAFASQAGLAIENARLHAREEQRTRDVDRRRQVAEGLRDLLATVNSTRTLDELLEEVAAQAGRLLGSAASAIYLPETVADDIVLGVHASSGLAVGYRSVKIPAGMSATGLAFSKRRPVAVYDLLAALPPDTDEDLEPILEERISHLRGVRLPVGRGPTGPLFARGPQVGAYAAGYMALLAVPLAVKDEIYGALTLYYRDAREFGGEELALAAAFADQAALAMENARLHTESERRLHDIEALYRADESLYRSLRLEDVLQALVDEAATILQAEKTSVLIWDSEHTRLSVRAAHGFEPRLLERMSFAPGEGISAQVAASGEVVAVLDVNADPRIPPYINRAINADASIRSLISVPIKLVNEVFGVFKVNSTRPRSFGHEEQRLLVALADRAALAIENARVHAQAEQSLRELEALYRADEIMHSSLRVDEVLQALLEVAERILGAPWIGVFLWDPAAQRMVTGAARGTTPAMLAESFALDEAQIVRESLEGPTVSAVEDLIADPRISERLRAIARREGLGAALSGIIRSGSQVLGSFTLGYPQPRTFSQEERRLLGALAQRAALAIHNARLFEQAQQAATLEERQRLARDLHDAVTQTLFSTALIAEVIPELWDVDPPQGRRRLEELRRLTRGALAEMRTLLIELRPGALTELPLRDLLRQLVEATAGRTRLELANTVEGDVRPLPAATQVALYRIAQEGLNNVVKHAQAGRAAVKLQYEPDGGICLRLEDDGRGFDSSAIQPGHLGLSIMRERADAIGASFQLTSSPGAGTAIEVLWHQTEEATNT